MWDETYSVEVKNFQEHGDVGEVWFGEDTMEKVVGWLEDSSDIEKSDAVIDLGCGNGMLLIELRKCGFTNLTGIDYSESGLILAKSVSESEGFNDIEFLTGDLTADSSQCQCTCLSRKYKVCVDKGTYDAISLMPGDSMVPRRAYLNTVKNLMQGSSLFILTSCNWTKEQLVSFFQTDFDVYDQIPFPTFQFGGQTGSKVTSLVFKLKIS